jgi:hypothetical protein
VEDYIDKLEQAIRQGATYELAALYAGVSSRTFERWRSRWSTAKRGSALARLRERVRQAEGQAAMRWLVQINLAAQHDWHAAAFMLSRRYPEDYGRTVSPVAPTSPDGHTRAQGLAVLLPSSAPTPEQWA